MTETLKLEDVHNPQLQAIIDAPLPPVRRERLRHEERKVWAREVRALFKALGLTGISVTTPSYSMAHSIDITLPKSDPEPIVTDEDGYPALHPVYRAQREAALDKAGEIILTAFPDLDDRSDSISDYYDFCLAIH
jgi:hypothetical protein